MFASAFALSRCKRTDPANSLPRARLGLGIAITREQDTRTAHCGRFSMSSQACESTRLGIENKRRIPNTHILAMIQDDRGEHVWIKAACFKMPKGILSVCKIKHEQRWLIAFISAKGDHRPRNFSTVRNPCLRFDCKFGDLTSQIVCETRGPVSPFRSLLATVKCRKWLRGQVFNLFRPVGVVIRSAEGLTLKVFQKEIEQYQLLHSIAGDRSI